jgi:hypothetical protein
MPRSQMATLVRSGANKAGAHFPPLILPLPGRLRREGEKPEVPSEKVVTKLHFARGFYGDHVTRERLSGERDIEATLPMRFPPFRVPRLHVDQ